MEFEVFFGRVCYFRSFVAKASGRHSYCDIERQCFRKHQALGEPIKTNSRVSSQYGTRSLRRKKEPRAEVRTAAPVFLFRLYSSNPLQLQVMLGVLPGAARFYSRPSDRCGTFKGPSFPLPRPRLFFFFSGVVLGSPSGPRG